MNEEPEPLLRELRAGRAPASLRVEVLAAVQCELNRRPRWHRRHALGLTVAAMLALAVLLNWGVAATGDALQARIWGATPRSTTSGYGIESMRAYQRLVMRLANHRGIDDDNLQEGTGVERDHSRRGGTDPTGYQRLPGLADRLPA